MQMTDEDVQKQITRAKKAVEEADNLAFVASIKYTEAMAVLNMWTDMKAKHDKFEESRCTK